MKEALSEPRMKPPEPTPVSQVAATSFLNTDEIVLPSMIEVENLDFYYGQTKALHDIHIKIPARQVTAFIGPSGCGKSTLLRCFNRMNDMVDIATIGRGHIHIHGIDIHHPDVDVIALRRQVG